MNRNLDASLLWHDDLCLSMFSVISVASAYYFTAYGFTGEPTAPVIGSAGATNMNS